MHRTALLSAAVLAALAVPSAEAACVGCGGMTGTPGSASIGATGHGLFASHVATADCHYDSVPNPTTGARGFLGITVRAESQFVPSMAVAGTCWIESPAYYSVSASAHGPSPSVNASRDEAVPPDMVVGRICVRLVASWSSGVAGDATDATECTTGVSGTVGGLHVEIPLAP